MISNGLYSIWTDTFDATELLDAWTLGGGMETSDDDAGAGEREGDRVYLISGLGLNTICLKFFLSISVISSCL